MNQNRSKKEMSCKPKIDYPTNAALPSSPPALSADEGNRAIYVSGVFDETQARNVIARILGLEMKDPTKDTYFYRFLWWSY